MNVQYLHRCLITSLRKHDSYHRSNATMISPPALVSHLEVERKFLPTPYLKACLYGKKRDSNRFESNHDKRSICPLKFSRLPDKLLRDIYYDNDGTLASKGIWIRFRSSRAVQSGHSLDLENAEESSKWEAKVRLAGDYGDSQFLELEGESSVRVMLRQHLPRTPLESLAVTADLKSHRKTWVIYEALGGMGLNENAEVRIDLDDVTASTAPADGGADFKHEVGELEMTRDLAVGTDEVKNDDARLRAAGSMYQSLDRFMMSYKSLFPCSPKPKGKLAAYFDWEEDVLGGGGQAN